MVLNIIAFIFRDQDFFKRRAFLLTHPVHFHMLASTKWRMNFYHFSAHSKFYKTSFDSDPLQNS